MSSSHDTTEYRTGSTHLAFEALADPIRREILTVLSETDECSAGDLAEQIVSVGRTAVSTHLRVLRVAGLVTERRAGRYRFYSINPGGAAAEVIAVLSGLFRRSLSDARATLEERADDDEWSGAAGEAAG